jgi:ribosomal protein S18 acetylase RimI-like enzyme
MGFDTLTEACDDCAVFSHYKTDLPMTKPDEAPSVDIVQADLSRPDHQQWVLDLVDAYAADPMGNGRPLPARIKRDLIPGLQRHPTTLIFLARFQDEAVGIAVCFIGFSTFAARPLINIHDLAVLPGQRGLGIGKRLLAAVEHKARDMGCCKVTLEVLENNHRALNLYAAAGFARATYTEEAGGALFFAKPL